LHVKTLLYLVKYMWFSVSSGVLLLITLGWPVAIGLVDVEKPSDWGITKQAIAEVLTPSVRGHSLPEKLLIPDSKYEDELTVHYTLDRGLQHEAQRLLKRYNPDYGIFVAIEPRSGRILAMAESSRDGLNHGNLSLSNTYPAASISKIITAVAAVNEDRATGSTIIPFNGKSSSLYKKNVFRHKQNKWTRNLTLNESFAKSVNVVFGRLGAVDLGGQKMMEYAYRLGFNQRFLSDFVFDNGYIELDIGDSWQVAEMASGYTTRNTLSPLHAAALSATAVNGGKLVTPVLVESMVGPHGIPAYVHENPSYSEAMSESSAEQLKTMMQATIQKGSAKSSFRRFHRGDMAGVRVGGKTGSLTGFHPRGKYDWFVGFGEMEDRQIAYAVLCINKEKWYVKSSRFAREMMEFYFSPETISQTADSMG